MQVQLEMIKVIADLLILQHLLVFLHLVVALEEHSLISGSQQHPVAVLGVLFHLHQVLHMIRLQYLKILGIGEVYTDVISQMHYIQIP